MSSPQPVLKGSDAKRSLDEGVSMDDVFELEGEDKADEQAMDKKVATLKIQHEREGRFIKSVTKSVKSVTKDKTQRTNDEAPSPTANTESGVFQVESGVEFSNPIN